MLRPRLPVLKVTLIETRASRARGPSRGIRRVSLEGRTAGSAVGIHLWQVPFELGPTWASTAPRIAGFLPRTSQLAATLRHCSASIRMRIYAEIVRDRCTRVLHLQAFQAPGNGCFQSGSKSAHVAFPGDSGWTLLLDSSDIRLGARKVLSSTISEPGETHLRLGEYQMGSVRPCLSWCTPCNPLYSWTFSPNRLGENPWLERLSIRNPPTVPRLERAITAECYAA